MDEQELDLNDEILDSETESIEELDLSNKKLTLIFIKEHRDYFNKNNKKCKFDYILNIDKLIKEKFNLDSMLFLNKTQAFLLNYEVKKLLDKAIRISDSKYNKIIYVNENLNMSGIINIMYFLNNTYGKGIFTFKLYDKLNEMQDIKNKKEAEDLFIISNFDDIII